MSNDHVRDSIRTLADAGPAPDVDAAWRRLQPRLEARGGSRGAWPRRSAIALVAAAAVVIAVAVGRPGGDDAVQLDSAGEPSGGTTGPDTQQEGAPGGPTETAVGTPITFPADAIVVSDPEFRVLHVLDAVTGERATTISGPPGGYTISSGAVTAGGDVWFVAQTPDGSGLGRTRWDAGDQHELLEPPTLLEGAGFGGLAVDPGGRWVAGSAMEADGTCWLAVHTPATGGWRAIRWPDGERRGMYRCPSEMSASPDGERLAFLNTHDSDGTESFEAFVVDVDATSLADARLVSADAWDLTFEPAGGLLALVGPDRATSRLQYLEDGPDVGVPALDGVIDLRLSLQSLVARIDSGWSRLDAARDEWVPTPLDRWTGR